MTDNEIIKVLEKEADFDCGICCDNGENCLGEECASLISRAALDLINRQKAEIARLQTDVAPVRHGYFRRLTFSGDTIICSECKMAYNIFENNGAENFNFCPHCGAKMDEQ